MGLITFFPATAACSDSGSAVGVGDITGVTAVESGVMAVLGAASPAGLVESDVVSLTTPASLVESLEPGIGCWLGGNTGVGSAFVAAASCATASFSVKSLATAALSARALAACEG